MPLLFATHDSKAIIASVYQLLVTSFMLRRIPLVVVVSESSSIPAVRAKTLTSCAGHLEKLGYPAEGARGIMLDSDIEILNEAEELAVIIKEADEKNYSIIANYKDADYNSVLVDPKDYTRRIPNEEYDKMEQYSECLGGLGFYYGVLPYGYKFRINTLGSGEDLLFFIDNKISPRVDKRIRLAHHKYISIK